MGTTKRNQILDVLIPSGKVMNPAALPPAMGKLEGGLGSLVYEKEN